MPRPKPSAPYHRLLINLAPDDLVKLDDLVRDDQRETGEVVARADVIRRLIRLAWESLHPSPRKD